MADATATDDVAVAHEQWATRRRRIRALMVAVVVVAAVGGVALWRGMHTEQCFQKMPLGFSDDATYDPRELAERFGDDIPSGADGPAAGLRDEPGTYTWTDGGTSWELIVERSGSSLGQWEFGAPRICRQV